MGAFIPKMATSLCAIIAANAVAMTTQAPLPKPIFLVFGAGADSCAKSFSNERQAATFIWIMGYFSGRNRETYTVGRSTDGEGVMGEVQLLCEAEPSTLLVSAAGRVYNRMRDQGR